MVSEATLSAIRFGYGPAGQDVAPDAEAHLERLGKGDAMVRKYPAPTLDEAIEIAQNFRAARKRARELDNPNVQREARQAINRAAGKTIAVTFARIADTNDPLRERLVWFWADHFTAMPKSAPMRTLTGDYRDAAIRPHVTGRFGDMLKAAVTHPLMLAYLDQIASFGPGSRAGKRRGVGLNENLAREVLELHTLGVGAAYSQTDVRELAELFTGLGIDPKRGFVFRPRAAEPGMETVLGKRYGGGAPDLGDIHAVLEDLAVHPATARHISGKLAVHFVADRPDPTLVDAMTDAWIETGGDLAAVTGAMLRHPAAWRPEMKKARQPVDYLAATLVALGVSGRVLAEMPMRDVSRFLVQPLRMMGQPFGQVPGPDGWPEDAAHWITPQGLAARLAWSLGAAKRLGDRAPDPRDFVGHALGDAASERLRWAVGAAETRAEGVALVLASAEFNRR